ncbi:uncharacterized protein LOC108670388 [Hyalella azteca]|uniref:Uncharacterized protein LOC108670388 n=1 Tax=Hyalella azteca TaxID=294128 RepID=A0A8B7NI78_HYAAZ|nr:uncharacterized protein LOC108670388 [Hyalella azteca]
MTGKKLKVSIPTLARTPAQSAPSRLHGSATRFGAPCAKPGATSGKPGNQGSSYRPISLLCTAVKILEHLLLPYISGSLVTVSSQHGFKPDDLTIFVSSPRLDAAEADLSELLRGVSDWSTAKKLAGAPGKSSVTLFTPDTHQSRLHPSATICNCIIPLDKTPKILGVTWDTLFTFSPHVRAIATKAIGSLRILKALASTNWGFSKEDIIATYRTITRPILNYAAPIWYPVASRTAIASLQIIQNSALRLATGCIKMAPIAHLHHETGVLPLSAHLDLACAQFLGSALQPTHASFTFVSAPPGDRPIKASIKTRFGHLVAPFLVDGMMPDGANGEAKCSLRREIATRVAATAVINAVLTAPPPPIAAEEASLPRPYRSALSQLRSGYCSSLASHTHRAG